MRYLSVVIDSTAQWDARLGPHGELELMGLPGIFAGLCGIIVKGRCLEGPAFQYHRVTILRLFFDLADVLNRRFALERLEKLDRTIWLELLL